MVIHLRRLIKELRELMEKERMLHVINDKSIEIYNACDNLLKEHGESSDTGQELLKIKTSAESLMKLCEKRDLFSGYLEFDYDNSINFVRAMEVAIDKIGRILDIEFEETQD